METNMLQIVADIQTEYQKIVQTLDLETKKSRISVLLKKEQDPNFWDNSQISAKLLQEKEELKKFVVFWESFEKNIQTFQTMIDSDSFSEEDLMPEILKLKKEFLEQKILVLLNGEYDNKNVVMRIFCGNGGQDAEDFSKMIFRMYLRFAEKRGWSTKILDLSETPDGIKSATFEVRGQKAYGYLKNENGVHRLIRQSPFNAKGLRQTSFLRMEVLPLIEQSNELKIGEKDIRIDVFRSGGNGGQSVNTTDSAVRVTYIPLGLSVSCQSEKSQHQNKDSAMKILISRLTKLKIEQNKKKLSDLRGDMAENSFGSQIRTFTLHPYKMVKDHRTNIEHKNPEKVLDGDLDEFIETGLTLS